MALIVQKSTNLAVVVGCVRQICPSALGNGRVAKSRPIALGDRWRGGRLAIFHGKNTFCAGLRHLLRYGKYQEAPDRKD
jgi:hypothetical protein